MKLWATLDYVDGETVVRQVDQEVLPRFSAMWLSDPNVVGVTFTKQPDLFKLRERLRK